MSALFVIILGIALCWFCIYLANAQTKQSDQAQDLDQRSKHLYQAKLLKAIALFFLVFIVGIVLLIALFFMVPMG